MTTILIWIKQRVEKLIPDGANRFWFYVFAALSAITLGVWLAACGATYTHAAKVETNWLGQVTTVEGGSTTQHGAPWASGLSELLGSVSWLLVVGVLVLLVIAWKAPSLLHRFKARREARKNLN